MSFYQGGKDWRVENWEAGIFEEEKRPEESMDIEQDIAVIAEPKSRRKMVAWYIDEIPEQYVDLFEKIVSDLQKELKEHGGFWYSSHSFHITWGI